MSILELVGAEDVGSWLLYLESSRGGWSFFFLIGCKGGGDGSG